MTSWSAPPSAIAAVASLAGDTTRASVLSALMGSERLSASVLAAGTGVSASTMSQHLSKLKAGGLVACELCGRNRYYRLANESVAAAMEALAACAAEVGARPDGSSHEANLATARLCYDHLGGALGVAILEALETRGALSRRTAGGGRPGRDPSATPPHSVPLRITYSGMALLGDLGVVLPGGSRAVIRTCQDWSQQQAHLAGRAGAAILARMLELGWLERGGDRRALSVTPEGRTGLRDQLGVVTELT